MPAKRTVAAILTDAADLYKQRDGTYGSAYKRHGAIIKAFFPNGLELVTEQDFNRFHLFNMCAGKLNRYASTFELGGHVDSVDDLSVYAAMLQETDNE